MGVPTMIGESGVPIRIRRYDNNNMMYACYVIYFIFLSVSEGGNGVVRRTHIPSVYLVHDD